ncbi:MAG: dynamin family protein [Ilumatobacteraceae bacterium]
MSALSDLRPLLTAVIDDCDDAEVGASLSRLAVRLDEPLLVAIAGKVKAGKSTLLNALVGDKLAPTDAGECTHIVTWYRNAPTYKVVAHLADGSSTQLPFRRDDGALEFDLGAIPAESVDRIVVDWPSSRLADMTLIDTPGLDSVNTHISDRTHRFLTTDEDRPGQADAVVYLMRHIHQSDLGFLESFRDDAQAGATPISSIAVLSRADEIGVCRLDAMSSAQKIAHTWQADPRLRRLCQTVVPVAGLIAEAGATLREDEYRTLASIAALPRPQADGLLLSIDRFVADVDCGVTQVAREDLLQRLGIFGVRVAVGLIRLGAAPTSTVLAKELTGRSGVGHLRHLLATVLTNRRDVLKARVALSGLEAALSALPGDRFDRHRADIERISASAHEFEEVHLLNAVRSGTLKFRESEVAELEQLLGGIGTPPHHRLGLDADADVRTAALGAIERWRRRAENPITSLELAQASRSIARTYEGLIAEGTAPRPA